MWIDKRLEGYPLDANTFNPRSLCALLEGVGFQQSTWHGLKKHFGTVVVTRGDPNEAFVHTIKSVKEEPVSAYKTEGPHAPFRYAHKNR